MSSISLWWKLFILTLMLLMMLWIEFRHPRQTHGNAAPLVMFVVWINNNNNIKPTVFVWYSTPPKTIYLGCFLSLLVVLNHKSGVWHHLRPGILGHLGPGMFDCFCISFCFESQGLPSVPPGTRTRGYWLASRIRIGHLWVARLRFKMHFPPFKCQISFYNFDPFSRSVSTSGDLGPLTEPGSDTGTLGGTTVKAEVEFWHNFAFIVWHNSARKASPIDACSLWQFSMFYKSAEDWWRIHNFVQWNSIMEPEISTIIFSLCTWPKPINTGAHLGSEIQNPCNCGQCPAGRVFQYRVGYWTKYRVAGLVRVG